LFSPELAAATGIKLNSLNLGFLLAFSLTVLIGLRFMGALLAGALIIIPAATGRRLANSIGLFLLASSLVSVLAVGLAFWSIPMYSAASASRPRLSWFQLSFFA